MTYRKWIEPKEPATFVRAICALAASQMENDAERERVSGSQTMASAVVVQNDGNAGR